MFNCKLLNECITSLENTDWDYAIEQNNSMLINLLCNNIEETMSFFNECCTAYQLTWLSCIFDDVIELTQSPNLLFAMHNLVTKYEDNDDVKKHHVKSCMRFADGALNDEAWAEFEKMMQK